MLVCRYIYLDVRVCVCVCVCVSAIKYSLFLEILRNQSKSSHLTVIGVGWLGPMGCNNLVILSQEVQFSNQSLDHYLRFPCNVFICDLLPKKMACSNVRFTI